MISVRTLCFLFTLLYCGALNSPDVCVLDDLHCVRRGAITEYNAVISGLNGTLPVLDPCYIHKMVAECQSEKFIVTKIELEGLRDCNVRRLGLNVTDESYRHYVHCPKLKSKFVYEATKASYSHKNCRKIVTLTASNYEITNIGEYGVFVEKKDLQPHFFIQTVKTLRKLKGQLTFDISDDTSGDDHDDHDDDDDDDADDSHKKRARVPSHKDQKKTVECLLSVIVKKSMKIFMAGVDTYLKKYLMGEVFPGSKCKSPPNVNLDEVEAYTDSVDSVK